MNQLTLTECSRRRLDSTYVVVYAIKNEINIKSYSLTLLNKNITKVQSLQQKCNQKVKKNFSFIFC